MPPRKSFSPTKPRGNAQATSTIPIERPISPYDKESGIVELVCPRCGKRSTDIMKDFFASKSPMFEYGQSIPVCRDCINELYQMYTLKYNDADFALRVLCANFDVYYSQTAADNTANLGEGRFNEYLRRVSVATSKLYKNYADTIAEDMRRQSVVQHESVADEHGVSEATVRLFGVGYEEDDYRYLQDQYDDWTKRYECKEKSLEEMIKNICIMQLNIRKVAQSGADISKLIKSLNDTIAMANLKPVVGSEEKDAYSIGELIAQFEKEKPVEEDPAFEDVDGIKKYVSTWFFGQLAKVFGKRNQYSDIYDDEMAKYTVTPPEHDDEESYDSIFGDGGEGSYDG